MTSTTKLTKHPSISSAIYKGHNLPEVIDLYSENLRSTKIPECIAHANALQSYKQTAINERHLSRIRILFNKTFKLIYNSASYGCTLEARRKSLLSTNNKILKLQHDMQSLDLIRDFIGFRVIIYGNASNLALKCYELMQQLVDFYNAEGFVLCDAASTKNTGGFKKEEHPEISIPSKKEIDKTGFTAYYGVKDYISHPKTNGYQSLHAVFRDDTGKFFEVQIRTLEQHIMAEADKASHEEYKNNLYSKFDENLNLSKVHIPGFQIAPNGEIFDLVGLTKSLLIFHRQKTF